MPSIVRRPQPARPRIVVPRRIGLALRPEDDREAIPARVTLGQNAPPFAGELREEQFSEPVKRLLNDDQVVLATLRRAWNFVGFSVDPGDAANAGLTAQLLIKTRGVDAYTAPVAITAPGRPVAIIGLIVGAPCELIVTNATGGTVHKLRGSIWGMSEK